MAHPLSLLQDASENQRRGNEHDQPDRNVRERVALVADIPTHRLAYAEITVAQSRVFGVAYTAVFALLGHAFPVWYGFRGGKGFLVNLASVFFLDWRAGLIALAVMVLLLLTTKYMSLATMAGLVLGAVSLIFFRTETVPLILYAACVLFTVVRHHENIVRLIKGTEAKFSFGGGKKSEAA